MIADEDMIPILKASQGHLRIAQFKCQKAAEMKLQEITERKGRRGCLVRTAALSAPIEAGEQDTLEDDGEEDREVSMSNLFLLAIRIMR
ncbi:unnamed protein product [Urochloa humidicola]